MWQSYVDNTITYVFNRPSTIS